MVEIDSTDYHDFVFADGKLVNLNRCTKNPVIFRGIRIRTTRRLIMELIESNVGWSPYLSLDDTYKLDDVREALCRGDIRTAARFAKVCTRIPIAI